MGILFLALALILFPVGGLQETNWKEFISKEGNFAISFPGTPTEEKQVASGGGVSLESHQVKLEQEKIHYIINYTDIPEVLLQQGTAERMFNAGRDGTVRGMKGKLLSDETVTLNGYPGRMFQVTNEGGVIKSKAFLVKSRLYQIIVEADKDADLTYADRFLSSFMLLTTESNDIQIVWKELKSEEGRFAMIMPGIPKEHSETSIIETFPTTMHGYLSVDRTVLYIAAYSDLPQVPKGMPEEEILDRFCNASIIKGQGEVLNQSAIVFEGRPGREMVIALNDGKVVRIRYYAVGNRIYQLSAFTSGETAGTENVDRFFNSFKLLENILGDQTADGLSGNNSNSEKKNSGKILRENAIESPAPKYPQDGAAKHIEGDVIVRVFIDEKGNVTDVLALSGPELLQEAACLAAKGWKFKPALLKDKPVKVVGHLTFHFKL